MSTIRHDHQHHSADNDDSAIAADPALQRFRHQTLSVRHVCWQTSTRLLVSLIGAGSLVLSGCSEILPQTETQPQETPQTVEDTDSQAEAEPEGDRSLMPTDEDTNFVVKVVEDVGPSVVRIDTTQTVETQLPDFFGDFFGESGTAPPGRTVRGIGSGFVIDNDGHILTNAHVVDGADRVTVTFSDGSNAEGEVVGADSVTDIAVVQVPADDLLVAELAPSDQVKIGQWAIAIGNPVGLQETVTVGVVGGMDRSGGDIGIQGKRVGFIQTDAAINPGNSGGPLLNARGEVIGVNTAIIGDTEGIGFAIPIDTAQRIAQQLIEDGQVEHPYIGVQITPLTADIKQRINESPNSSVQIDADQGVLVVRVQPNSPAARAGIEAGDVIQNINGQTVTEVNEVLDAVEENGVGNEMSIELQRSGETQTVTIQPEPLPTGS
ncbi:MAG TPA: HhoA/HhoB/HtrA family serine endopeptidase [Elainellaceae cyanobacterium]|jgi:S1-C subfamily serine protease